MAETDPNGIPQHEPGAKLDAGKIRADLLDDFSLALMAIAEVCTHGADKYSPGGWQFVARGEQRYRAAAARHRLKGRYERKDAKSGLDHKAHELWGLLASYELQLRRELGIEPSLEPSTDTIFEG